VAVGVGLSWALLLAVHPAPRSNPYEAFRTYFITVCYATSVPMMFDMPNVARCCARRAIAILKRRVPYAVYLLTRNLYDYPRGEVGAVRRQSQRILEILERDRLTPIRDIDRRAFCGAARYMLALVAVSEVEPTWTIELEHLANIHMRFYDIGAENARAIFHRMRGEEDIAAESKDASSSCSFSSGRSGRWRRSCLSSPASRTRSGDTLGLRRAIDRLSRLVSQGFHFAPYVELARGEYLREHGELHEAKAAIERSMDTELGLVRIAALPALAERLALGELDRACEIARGYRAGRRPRARQQPRPVAACARRARRGARAARSIPARRLDTAIAKPSRAARRCVGNTARSARARRRGPVQWAAYHAPRRDRASYRASRNPVLIAQAGRLAQLAARAAARTPAGVDVETAVLRKPELASLSCTSQTRSDAASWISGQLAGCRSRGERAQRLLDIAIDEARGESGFLFVRGRGGVTLAAPAWGTEPPDDLVCAVEQLFETTPSPTIAQRPSAWRLIAVRLLDAASPIGCVAVAAGAAAFVDPAPELLAEIARRLSPDLADDQFADGA
jgi:hypothetical protein